MKRLLKKPEQVVKGKVIKEIPNFFTMAPSKPTPSGKELKADIKRLVNKQVPLKKPSLLPPAPKVGPIHPNRQMTLKEFKKNKNR